MKSILLTLLLLSCQNRPGNVSRETGDGEKYIFLSHYIGLFCSDCGEDFKWSHKIGLEESGFTLEEMPFRTGRVSQGTIGKGLKLGVVWQKKSDSTLCELKVTTEQDGTFISSESSCVVL